ncbi:MAG: hypothetical protein IJ239_08100 [Eubacterium sp.]|nr:hypothetical protein [Erysipelotrichaceae bacterium]MBQ9322293.1 hypothetical protein [Eubacterium sp.]
MRYDISGSREAPVLLMFPGSFGSARMMQGYTDLLKEKYCVVAVTLDGCDGTGGGESFAVSEKIRIYDGTGYEDQPFPQKEEIRAVYDGDLFERLQKDFMGRRNADFIA